MLALSIMTNNNKELKARIQSWIDLYTSTSNHLKNALKLVQLQEERVRRAERQNHDLEAAVRHLREENERLLQTASCSQNENLELRQQADRLTTKATNMESRAALLQLYNRKLKECSNPSPRAKWRKRRKKNNFSVMGT